MSRRNRVGFLVSAMIAACCLPLSILGAPPALQDAPSSAADIEQWIRQLDSNEFVMRKVATQNLIRAGRPAISPLAEVLRGSNLEVTTRAVHALRELALQGDETAELEAREALENVAKTRPTAASRLASDALIALNEQRQQRAMERLRKLGAKIGFAQNQGAFAAQMAILQVEIGPAWQGTASDLRQLRWIEELDKLILMGPKVDDSSLSTVEKLPNLRYLTIRNAKVTDAALRHIRHHRVLSELDLMYIPVTDSCVEDLKTLVNATRIRIFGTQVSSNAALELDNALANATIEHKQGAFLGVRCHQGPLPCEVSRVVAGSAADQAGVRPGDIIIEYGGNPIRNFDDLRQLIGQNKVGETIDIQVIRGGQPILAEFTRLEGLKMGITAKEQVLGCEVTAVAADSAAAKAKLKKGDVILEFNDERITSLKQLEEAYSEAPVNQESEFGFLRNASTLQMKARFGEWQDED
jgi:hypothetical protein